MRLQLCPLVSQKIGDLWLKSQHDLGDVWCKFTKSTMVSCKGDPKSQSVLVDIKVEYMESMKQRDGFRQQDFL